MAVCRCRCAGRRVQRKARRRRDGSPPRTPLTGRFAHTAFPQFGQTEVMLGATSGAGEPRLLSSPLPTPREPPHPLHLVRDVIGEVVRPTTDDVHDAGGVLRVKLRTILTSASSGHL